jgi:hypothetical protein
LVIGLASMSIGDEAIMAAAGNSSQLIASEVYRFRE